jgi:hypothetical protein
MTPDERPEESFEQRPEQRSERRRRVLKGAAIWFSGRMSTLDYVVRDLTEHGCRLKTDGALWAPETFELSLGQGAIIERCRVVWRKPGEMGVRFQSRDPKPAEGRAA